MSARRSSSDETAMLVEAATEAIVALEGLAEGAPFAEEVARAEELLTQLHERAGAQVFPDALSPIDPGTAYDLQSNLPATPGVQFVRDIIELHGMAYLALAEAVRSSRVRRAVIFAASATAGIRGMKESEAIAADLAVFEQGIAAQLAVKNELQPWSAILAEVLPGLRGRFAQAKIRHEQAAAEAVARLRREQEEADRVLSEMKANQEREAIATRAASEAEARRAEVRARQLHAERIADRIRRAGLQNLRVGGVHYAAANLLELLDSNSVSEAQIAAYEDALDKQEGVRA